MAKLLSDLQGEFENLRGRSVCTEQSCMLISSDRLVSINSSEVIGCITIEVYLGKVMIGYWHGRTSVICVFQKWLESKPKPRTSRQVIHNNPNGTRDKYICSFDKNKQILLHHRCSRETTGVFSRSHGVPHHRFETG